MQSTWYYKPIHIEILRILVLKGGIAKDKDIYEILRKYYDISYTSFLKRLLALELRGLITVRQQKENVRIVELTPLGRRMQI